MTRKTMAAATLGAVLITPAAAQAHVTLQPKEAPAGAYVVENVRVPNERDDAATTKVVVQFPTGFESVSYAPVGGWDVEVQKAGDAVETVTFSGGKIEPGQFVDFPLSVKIPDDAAGKPLTFKALQTYEGGEVVRWIGAPDSDKPAPQLAITEAEGEGGHAATKPEDAAATEETAATEATPAAAATGDGSGGDGDGDGTGLAIAALAVGLLGLGVGGAGFAKARSATA